MGGSLRPDGQLPRQRDRPGPRRPAGGGLRGGNRGNRLWIYEGTLPTEITGTREGRLVYAMPFTDTETEYIDVYRTGGTIHYFVQSDDGIGESSLELKPWGTLYADGMKIS